MGFAGVVEGSGAVRGDDLGLPLRDGRYVPENRLDEVILGACGERLLLWRSNPMVEAGLPESPRAQTEPA